MALKKTQLVSRVRGDTSEFSDELVFEEVASVCAREVQPIDVMYPQPCGQPVVWWIAGVEYCYKCGLEYALAHLKATGEALRLDRVH